MAMTNSNMAKSVLVRSLALGALWIAAWPAPVEAGTMTWGPRPKGSTSCGHLPYGRERDPEDRRVAGERVPPTWVLIDVYVDGKRVVNDQRLGAVANLTRISEVDFKFKVGSKVRYFVRVFTADGPYDPGEDGYNPYAPPQYSIGQEWFEKAENHTRTISNNSGGTHTFPVGNVNLSFKFTSDSLHYSSCAPAYGRFD